MTGEHHHLRTIAFVTATLLLLLALTVIASLFHLGAASLPVALAISGIKALVVLTWFMQLRTAPAAFRFAAGVGLLFLLLLLGGSLADVLTRPGPPSAIAAPQ